MLRSIALAARPLVAPRRQHLAQRRRRLRCQPPLEPAPANCAYRAVALTAALAARLWAQPSSRSHPARSRRARWSGRRSAARAWVHGEGERRQGKQTRRDRARAPRARWCRKRTSTNEATRWQVATGGAAAFSPRALTEWRPLLEGVRRCAVVLAYLHLLSRRRVLREATDSLPGAKRPRPPARPRPRAG